MPFCVSSMSAIFVNISALSAILLVSGGRGVGGER
jgi:hypothetical protein